MRSIWLKVHPAKWCLVPERTRPDVSIHANRYHFLCFSLFFYLTAAEYHAWHEEAAAERRRQREEDARIRLLGTEGICLDCHGRGYLIRESEPSECAACGGRGYTREG